MNTDWSGFGRAVVWTIFVLVLLLAAVFLVLALNGLDNVSYGYAGIDRGYEEFSIAYVALRLGAAGCLFLLALAIKPRRG